MGSRELNCWILLQDSKNNNNNNNNNGKNSSLEYQSSTDDINDLLSTFSLGASTDAANGGGGQQRRTAKSRASQRRKVRSVVLVSPSAGSIKEKLPKFSNIEVSHVTTLRPKKLDSFIVRSLSLHICWFASLFRIVLKHLFVKLILGHGWGSNKSKSPIVITKAI